MNLDAPHDVAIVGGGAAGTLVALHLLASARGPLRIVLVEPAGLAEGVAYATRCPEHVLNVQAARMSAFEAQPDDFVAYLTAVEDTGTTTAGGPGLGDHYAPRCRYAPYLRERLREAQAASPATLAVVVDRAVGVATDPQGHRIRLASGQALAARELVLALGNTARPLPLSGAADGRWPEGAVLQAWEYQAITAIDRDADVTVVGAGLSMVDVALTLSANGHRGRLLVLSRHALLPLPHAPTHEVAGIDLAGLEAMPLRARVRALRVAAREGTASGVAWQSLMNRLRPHVRVLWQSLSLADQRRFRRHVARHWDVHRHRIAPAVAAGLEALRSNGQLQLHRGRLAGIAWRDGRLEVTLADRHGARRAWPSDHLVNAVGVELQVARMGQPLLDDLVAQGRLRPGPHGLGVDTAPDGVPLAADGSRQAGVTVIGSLRIGSLLESIAVPDLRQDAQALAARLLATHGLG